VEYAPLLDKLYPYTYNYFTWDNTLKFWCEKFNAQKMMDSGKKIYLYLEFNDEELYNKTINKLTEENGAAFTVERELIYTNEITREIIYMLHFSSSENQSESAIK